MRFDDSLDTVLAAQVGGPAAIRAMWLQTVDLIGRRRPGPTAAAVARLRALRHDVPVGVRAASARGLERANPPAALVALFAEDETAVAAPVIRSARLSANEWIAILPTMRPATRGVLRHRRDLSDTVRGALAGFGPEDFALPSADAGEALVEPAEPAAERSPNGPAVAEPAVEPALPPFLVEAEAAPESERLPIAEPAAFAWPPSPEASEDVPTPAFVAPEPMPFIAVADIARELPVVAEAIRREQSAVPAAGPGNDFEIAEIVARIEAHQRAAEAQPSRPVVPDTPPDAFRFETDAHGVIRWCDTALRGPLIGLSLAAGHDGAPATADGSAGGALRKRARFDDARLTVPGTSPVGGGWRISAVPAFDHASGRFTGYRGTARRPRPDEDPRAAPPAPAADTLRQLVHELRTPANAISGFAEMIERELLGPVPPAYRIRAAEILGQTGGLLSAIDDIDTAARLESGTLDLRVEAVPLAPLLARIVDELNPLVELRGAALRLEVAPGAIAAGDAVAMDRLFSRLLTALVAGAARDEVVAGSVVSDGDQIRCELTRPAALVVDDGHLFSADAEVEAAAAGGPLLGGGFAFRLARKLTAELGGSLTIGAEGLTLRLPAAVQPGVEQATV